MARLQRLLPHGGPLDCDTGLLRGASPRIIGDVHPMHKGADQPTRVGATGATAAGQKAQRLAATGILLRHSGQTRVFGVTVSSGRTRSIRTLTGISTK